MSEQSEMPLAVSEWYRVSFDENLVYQDVAPPGGTAWKDQFAWTDVIRICFYTGGLFESDAFYVFTSLRAESHVIPTEAQGGQDFLAQLMERNLFPAELLLEAAQTEGEYFCWPPIESVHVE